MLNRREYLYGILLLGSLWGGLEALISAHMDGISGFIPRSVVLAFVALLLLTAGRRLMPGIGTTLAAGIVAASMKLLTMPSMLTCQFAAVIGQAVILEAAFSLLERAELRDRYLTATAVILAASYVNSLAFAFSQAYLFTNHWWLDRGVGGLLEWSLVTGSAAALASAAGFLLGRSLGARLATLRVETQLITAPVYRSLSVTVAAIIWIAVAL